MNKQGINGISWCTHTWNPIRMLCPEAYEYCYARRIYARSHYNPEIRLDEKELMAPYQLKKPGAKIFCGSTIEMFHQNIHGVWLKQIIEVIEDNPQHIFQFLYHFSPHRGIFPENCWLGLTVTSYRDAGNAIKFANTYPDHVKFISFEPLLGNPRIPEEVFEKIDWILIGTETGSIKGRIKPHKEWIAYLLSAAKDHHLPVYMKNNLKPYWHESELRQEFPKRNDETD
jgi:protein gp37